ncbi:MAG: hypothetical protein NTW31_13035 [Bacteroidetes bacterium]|nr:hypothetical protein [Bacteroidota bacterium]
MSWHREKTVLLLINLLAGGSVIGSYIQGFVSHPGKTAALWGNVPASLLPYYTLSMGTAAVGYLVFTAYLVFFVDPGNCKIFGRFPFCLFNWLYAIILVFSALWMPLTFIMLDKPSASLWLTIRFVLAIVGLGSVGFLAAVSTLKPAEPAWAHRSAWIGCIFFAFQTAILDTLVWTALFPFIW